MSWSMGSSSASAFAVDDVPTNEVDYVHGGCDDNVRPCDEYVHTKFSRVAYTASSYIHTVFLTTMYKLAATWFTLQIGCDVL